MGIGVDKEPADCTLTPGCIHCAGHLPPCMGNDGQRVYRDDEVRPARDTTCCRCGLARAEHTGDGSGGRAWVERHCVNFIHHPAD